MIEMIIIWSVVIAIALLVEFLTYDMITSWFAVGGIGALILAACNVSIWWQIFSFFFVSLACIILLRRYLIKIVRTKTTPTNLDANIGIKTKLLKDVKDSRSEIKVNDVVWTVACDDVLSSGDFVVIVGMAGNKYIVKKSEEVSK